MLTYPNAKVNLGLHVVEKRTDGYHSIETVFYPVKGLSDILEVLPSKANHTTLTNTGLLVDAPVEQNLCVKAWGLLCKDFSIPPVELYLHKQIPFGAGLGGGSADAACCLLLLNKLFTLNLSGNRLKEYALQLGSDCAFFIENRPMLATGRGEILKELPLSLAGKHIAIVYPPIHVSTTQAYANITPKQPSHSLAQLLSLPIGQWKERLTNDFEESIFKAHPQIAEIKEALYKKGAIYASMSGSGSSVFGIFEELPDISNTFTSCFTYEGILS